MDIHKELPGNEFVTVEKELDPKQVTEHLMKDAGANDSVFNKLEQFSALQKAASTIDEAIRQAKELAESAKARATEEAERRQAQAIEDGKEITAKIINEAGKNVIAYFDDVTSIVVGVIDEALKKAKDQVNSSRAKMREQIEKRVWAEIDRIVKDVDRNPQESSHSKPQLTDTSSTDKVPSAVSSIPSDPWQDAR
ncbi:MAG TPA: hypothetical protein G4O10_00290 [Dehalococcoidia bacterium]|nr:hypothetical protein [Dehalococcoidia bacterium]